MKTPDNHNELDWTAFCYAAGELSADETAAFENLLGEDQTAREALARAVELTQAVASAETLQPTIVIRSRSSVWTKRLTWMAIGSAASLLVALLWTGSGPLFRGQPGNSQATGELAAAWMAAQEELAAEGEAGQPPMTDNEIASDSEPVDLSELPETPSWMTAAVASLAGQPVPGQETPFENEVREN